MPEKNESGIAGKLAKEGVQLHIPLQTRSDTLRSVDTTRSHVQAIWFDGSEKECARAKKGTRLRDGLVDVLSATDNYKRGSTGGQTYLWPWRSMSSLSLFSVS